MRKKTCSGLGNYARLLVVCMAFALCFPLAACSRQLAAGPEPDATPAAETEEAAKEAEEEPTAYIRANDQFSNLQAYDFTKPVYDRYTVAQRKAAGLPVALPQLIPYTQAKVAYLTFDDGPDDKNTPAILDILKENGIPATFYVLGVMAENHPDVLKRIFAEGHAIGNHSYDHDYQNLYASKENFLAQIMHTDDILYQLLGVRPLIIRAPGGTVGMFTDEYPPMLKANGYVEHDWNVSSEDATPQRPLADEQIHNVDVQTNVQLKDNMALVLMHSTGGKEETVKALPAIIRILKEKGYVFGVVTPMTPQPW